jgi:hypothetical protein
MEFIKSDFVDLYVGKTSDREEAFEMAQSFMDLDIEYCFNSINDEFHFVLEESAYQKLTDVMMNGAIEIIEEALK